MYKKKDMNIESYEGNDAFYSGSDEEYEAFLKNADIKNTYCRQFLFWRKAYETENGEFYLFFTFIDIFFFFILINIKGSKKSFIFLNRV